VEFRFTEILKLLKYFNVPEVFIDLELQKFIADGFTKNRNVEFLFIIVKELIVVLALDLVTEVLASTL
jgi:hypothetical protein